MKKQLSIITLVFLMGATGSSLAGDAAAGKTKYQQCSSCHGLTAQGVPNLGKKLADKDAVYLKNQIDAFKSGARTNPMMDGMAKTISDTDIENLAAYFATLN